MKLLPLAFICFALVSCVSTEQLSTIDDEQTAYAITERQAASIVDASIRSVIAPDYMTGKSPDGLTQSGYIRVMLDTASVTVSAVPARGVDAKGKQRMGYGFMTSDSGTIYSVSLAYDTYEMAKKRARAVGDVLKTEHVPTEEEE